jgi:hypothetical protein
MSAPKKQPPFPGFTKLSDQVYLRAAGTSTTTSEQNDPTTIIIYAWGDAHPKHIAKYIDGYTKLYPSAKLIVVLGPMAKALYQNLEQRSRNMEVLIDATFSGSTGEGTRDERVLVHAMSNTGGINYAATLNSYSQQHPGAQFPHVLGVFDSTPGSSSLLANLGPWSRAMAIGASGWFPGPMVIMQSLMAVFLVVVHGFLFLIGRPSPAVFSTMAVNNPEMASIKAQRLYQYSKADEIIHWEPVEKHAADAKELGYQVGLEMFLDSPHCGHMRMYPERYWGAIRKAWDAAVGRGTE